MKTRFTFMCISLMLVALATQAQEIQTIFGQGRTNGGYGAISNKFSTIGGEFANISEIYGGVFINRRWMIGLAFAGSTNDIEVPVAFSVDPLQPMTYQYGQGGLKAERVFGSNRPVHLVVNLFSGVGFTAQYNRFDWHDYNYNYNNRSSTLHDENWFYVVEPGAQLEMNLFRWLRLSPGISYRQTYQSSGLGLSDNDLSDWSYSLTLKIGGFGKRQRVKIEDYSN